jgi:hypothetical protein
MSEPISAVLLVAIVLISIFIGFAAAQIFGASDVVTREMQAQYERGAQVACPSLHASRDTAIDRQNAPGPTKITSCLGLPLPPG